MSNVVGSEFKFDTETIQLPNLKRNPNVTFRVPIPLGKSDLPQASDYDSSHYIPPDSLFNENQHSVTIRAPFKNLIERNIEHTEKLFEVRMSIQEVDSNLKLIASGDKAEPSINEILNICRKSKVYNFYLCFPVRGEQFHKSFSDFQDLVRDRLGGNVHFEKRPHITLALVNLVTDSDIDLVVRALQVTSLTIKSVPKQLSQFGFDQYSLDMDGLGVVKYKGKFAKRSVLYTNVVLSETLSDIASEFQNSLNKAINTVLNNQPKRKKLNKSNRISNLTESQLAPKGVYITKGGNIEMTFTDVPVVDPNYASSRQNNTTEEDDYNYYNNEEKDNKNNNKDNNKKENEEYTNQNNKENEKDINQKKEEYNREEDNSDDEEEEESYEFDTAVKNKLHVTLLRHQQVNALSTMKFSSKGHVVSAELRPRNGETCEFTAYSSNELVTFVGNRFDNKQNDDVSTSQISRSQPPDIPNHYMVDLETEHLDNKAERFVFWI